MIYYAVYRKSDKRLISIGTSLPNTLNATLDYIELEEDYAKQALQFGYTWDKDNLEIIANDPPLDDDIDVS